MKYSALILIVLHLTGLFAAAQETDAERRGLRGRARFVAQYETYFCCSPNARRRGPRRLVGTASFNKKGGYTEWISINNTSDGPHYERRVFKYDDRGRKVGAEVYKSEKNPPETYFELVPGVNGSVKLTPERAEKLVERIAYVHDREGRMTEEVTRDVNENLIMRRVHQYDREGNIVRGTVFKEGGVIDNESISVVTEGGLFETTYIRPGTELQRSVYAKDKAGRTVRGEAFGLKPFGEKEARWVSLHRSKHTYSEGRERMDWILNNAEGEPERKIVILRDEHGETLSREEFNGGLLPPGSGNEDIEPSWTLRERNLYRREYDRRGNVVQSETRQQCGPELPLELTNIYEYVITYY